MSFGRQDPRFYDHPDGYKVPSVTTILSLLDKGPFLDKWKIQCAIDYIKENSDLHLLRSYKCGFIPDNLEPVLSAHKTKSKEATDIGTEIHLMAEQILNDEFDSCLPSELYQNFAIEFVKWIEKYNVKPIAMEGVLYGDGYAGRFDLVCEIDPFWATKSWYKLSGEKLGWPQTVLIDLKTGKGQYYNEHGIQLAAYHKAFNDENKIFRVDYHGVLKYNKETMKLNYKDFTYHEITVGPKDERVKKVLTYQDDLDSFLRLKDFYWLNNMKGKTWN
ncbi:MAG: hypothetical protein KAS32_10540 [Candidatus Peribacteraceae bacterium]|nr:hypothetical protein [Candidatus Peribacteraceae bacterium]